MTTQLPQGPDAGLAAAADAIRRATRILITTHINPDGDAVGSALGLFHILRAAGKDALVVSHDGAGQRYRFLPGADLIVTSTERRFDLGIAVDCGNIGRVGSVRQALEGCSSVMRVDHHAVGHSFGDVEYLDSSAAAVGEMIAELADAMGLTIPADAGECLLASIVEDTGCFQFSSVTPRSFSICSELVAAGADLHRVVQMLFWMRPEGAARLSGKCLSEMRMQSGGRIAWTIASLRDFETFGAVQEDVDDVVHELLSVAGVEASVLLRESERDYRVSLRSRTYVDAAEVAEEFGGGGHTRAAGCRISKGDEAVEALLSALARRLR